MPIYSYQGQKYKLSEEDPYAALEKIKGYVNKQAPKEETQSDVPPEKEKTSLLGDLGAGLRNAAETGLEGLGMAAAGSLSSPTPIGAAGAVTDALLGTDTKGAIFDAIKASREARTAREAKVDRGELGKVAQAVGAIPAYLNPLTAGAAIAGGGVDTALTMLDQGADVKHALAGQAADTALSLAGMKVGGMVDAPGKIANALVQGGMNVAQEAMFNHPVQNAIRQSAGIQNLPDMTPGDYAAQFVPGAAIGAMTAKPKVAKDVIPDGEKPTQRGTDEQELGRLRGVEDTVLHQLISLDQKLSMFPKDSMSEAQYNVFKDLHAQRDALSEEHSVLKDKIKSYEDFLGTKSVTEQEIQNIRDIDLGVSENPRKNTPPETAEVPIEAYDEGQGKPVTKPTGEVKPDPYETLDETPVVERPLDPSRPALLQGGTPEQKAALFQKPVREEQQAALLSGEPLPRVEADTAPTMSADVPALMRPFAKPTTEPEAPKKAALFSGKEIPKETPVPLDPSKPALLQSSIPDARKPTTKVDNTPALFKGAPEHLVNPKSSENVPLNPPVAKSTPVKAAPPKITPKVVVEEKKETATKLASELESPLYNIDVTNHETPETVLAHFEDNPNFVDRAYKIGRELFGSQQFVESIKREAPIVWETYKFIREALDTSTQFKHKWMFGGTEVKHTSIGPIMKLSHTEALDSVAALVPGLTDREAVNVVNQLRITERAFKRHTSVDLSHLTEREQKAIKTIEKFYDQIRADRGFKRRNGFLHTARKGDFAVSIKTSLGDVSHVEFMPDKVSAEAWVKKAQEHGLQTGLILDLKSEQGMKFAEAFETIKDVINELKIGGNSKTTTEHLDTLQNFLADNAKGVHNLRKHGYTGGVGTKLFKTDAQNAREFLESLSDYANEMATQQRKIMINKSMTNFFESEAGHRLKQIAPNQVETSKYLADIAMNNQTKYKIADSIDSIQKQIDAALVSGIRTTIGAAKNIPFFGKKITLDEKLWYPDIPITDKATGLAANLFYIRALTSRPAFWAGQILSSPFAMRQFLKEGSVLDTMAAQGKGLATFMSGGDKAWKDFVRSIADTTETLIPQLHTDINEIPMFGKDKHPGLSKLWSMATGQSPAAFADSTSRLMTMAMAYHFYKDMGMSGHTLKKNVQEAVDKTMVVYSRAYTPPFLTKSGFAGQHIAPLQKYGLAQLQNLIGDIKHIKNEKTLRSTLPMISTLVVTSIMAGSIGLPLLAEIEVLRLALLAGGKAIGFDDIEDWLWPSITEWMLSDNRIKDAFATGLSSSTGMQEETAKNLLTHGAVSAATGMDIGSSLRFNPYLPGTEGEVSLLNAFPIIKSTLDTGAALGTKLKHGIGGETTKAERRKADMLIASHVTGGKAYVDEARYDASTRSMVPGGTRGFGQVQQTDKERLATLLGTTSMETKKEKTIGEFSRKNKEKTMKQKSTAMDLLADGIESGDDVQVDRAINKLSDLGMTSKEITQQLKTLQKNRETNALARKFGGGVPKTKTQREEYLYQEKFK